MARIEEDMTHIEGRGRGLVPLALRSTSDSLSHLVEVRKAPSIALALPPSF